jgi:hypothetical protein
MFVELVVEKTNGTHGAPVNICAKEPPSAITTYLPGRCGRTAARAALPGMC